MMQELQIDFRRYRRSSPWAGRVLLALALAFAADVGVSYQQLRHAIAENGARLAQAQGKPVASAQKVAPEELALARETVQRIAMPWSNLFGALEEAASADVALLAIEPDPKAGTVLITGDSKDYLAALTYVLNLSRTEALSKVQLVRHEMKQNDPQKPVGFAVSASWVEAK
jgi:Tfp pilus assembly protein PilN